VRYRGAWVVAWGVAPGLATWGESGLPDCPADDRCGNESMRGTNDPPTGEPRAEEGSERDK